jgi:hypothetical protein
MTNIDVPQILSYGVIGFGFLLAVLAYQLLTREQKKTAPAHSILIAIYVFMAFSIALCLIGLVADQHKSIRDDQPAAVAESYVALSSNDEGGQNVMAEDLHLSRRGNVLSGEGQDLDDQKKSWHYAGYLNGAYLVLAYRSTDPDGIGFGTFFLEQADSTKNLYKGHLEGNSCAKPGPAPARRIVRCNAILVRGKSGGTEEQNSRKAYETYLGADGCQIIGPADLVPAEKCKPASSNSN